MILELQNLEGRMYLVVKYEYGNQPDRRLTNVLQYNELPCFVRPYIGNIEGCTWLYYDLSGRQSLTERLQQPMSAQYALMILKSLCELWKTEESYFLNEGDFVWDFNYMYVDSEGNLQCLYVPGYSQAGTVLPAREFVLDILARINSIDQENWEEICRIYTWIKDTIDAREEWYDICMRYVYLEDEPETEVLIGYNFVNPYETAATAPPKFKTLKQNKKEQKEKIKKVKTKKVKAPKVKKEKAPKVKTPKQKKQKKQRGYYPGPMIPSVQNM